MIRITETIWIGTAPDQSRGNLAAAGVGAVLCVAQDLRCGVGWPEVEYAQVGLVDGPGNPPAAYCAAVLVLATLLGRAPRQRVLVCCHEGGRSLAVVLMYLNAAVPSPFARRGWDDWLDILRERADVDLPVPHEAHAAAYGRMHWRILSKLLED